MYYLISKINYNCKYLRLKGILYLDIDKKKIKFILYYNNFK